MSIDQPRGLRGPDLAEVVTEALGFQSLAGESRLRLLPTPWPQDGLPAPTASLLSIASREELLAAVGPEVLVLGDLKAVREAFTNDGSPQNNIRDFVPQLTIRIPLVSHVAFSSDESKLILCATQGGGLAVYSVPDLKRGNQECTFQLSTNGVSVRSVAPNPAPDFAHLLAIVTEQGDLMIADLRERAFQIGSNGTVVAGSVSCVSWSNKGKQLTAGLWTGGAVQITPNGDVKAWIPTYPELEGQQHVSSILWLDNDHWLFIYTPSQRSEDGALDSTYTYVGKDKGGRTFTFQKLPDPCIPFGMNRSPSHHFLNRLRGYSPALTDMIILSSTVTGEIGSIACAGTPLSNDPTIPSIVNQYSTVSIAIDSRKAQLPLDENSIDSSPIGAALDLSSRTSVRRPIPAEEIELSPTPLPGFAVLNNEGILSYWWFVYSESIRQGEMYSGLIAASEMAQSLPANTMDGQAVTGPASFGGAHTSSSFSHSSSMHNSIAKPAGPAFGAPTAPGLGGTFATTSGLGAPRSPWASTNSVPNSLVSASLGQSTFGSTTSLGKGGGFSVFSSLDRKLSPWATSDSLRRDDGNKTPFASPFSTGQSTSADVSGNMAYSSSQPSLSSDPASRLLSGSNGFSGAEAAVQRTVDSTMGTGRNFSSSSASTKIHGDVDNLRTSTAAADILTARAARADMDDEMDGGETPQSSHEKGPPTFKGDHEIVGTSSSPFTQPTLFGEDFSKAIDGISHGTPTSVPFSKSQTRRASQSHHSKPVQDQENSATPTPAGSHSSATTAEADVARNSGQPASYLLPEGDVRSTALGPRPHTQAASPANVTLGVEKASPSTPPSGDVILGRDEVNEHRSSQHQDFKAPDDTRHQPDLLSMQDSTAAWLPNAHGRPAGREASFGSSQNLEKDDPSVSVPSQDSVSAARVHSDDHYGLPTTKLFPAKEQPSRRSNDGFDLPDKITLIERAKSGSRNDTIPNLVEIDSITNNLKHDAAAELADPLRPTKTLAPFLAHQDYVGHISGSGIPLQIETVYHDVTSMIDTLGLNARSVNSWIVGHASFKDGGRMRKDLEGPCDDWCLIETEDFSGVQRELFEELEFARVKDLKKKIGEAVEFRGETMKMKHEVHKLGFKTQQKVGPEASRALANPRLGSTRTIPALTFALAKPTTQDSNGLGPSPGLRQRYNTSQALFADVESLFAGLFTKLSVTRPVSQLGHASRPAVPTIEAILSTVIKLTHMMEDKREAIEILATKSQRCTTGTSFVEEDLKEELALLSLGAMGGTSNSHNRPRLLAVKPVEEKSVLPGTKRIGPTSLSMYSAGGTPSHSTVALPLTPSNSVKKGPDRVDRPTSAQTQTMFDEDVLEGHAKRSGRRRFVLAFLKEQVAKRQSAAI